jgi:hypothetical protein
MLARLSAKDWYVLLAISLLAIIASSTCLAHTYQSGYLGFPLDDAWIHQTYARNLAETGQLAFRPGQPSAGSTSPAWSFLLSVGYLVGIDFRLWAYLLGAAALVATAILVYRLFRHLEPKRSRAALLVGLFCAVEWHLVWAAVSGMETMLFTALSLGLLDAFLTQVEATRRGPVDRPASLEYEARLVRSVGIGLLSGILVLTRPEGLGLAGLVFAGLLLFPRASGWQEIRSRLFTVGVAFIAFAIVLAPYVAFNLNTSGSPWPNTFYAKQIEYQTGGSFLLRLWRVLSPTLVGAQVLLVPGFLYAAYEAVRRRTWPALLPLLWWLAFLIAYALRLPVGYQHGRYTMPTIPIFILYGAWGTAVLLSPRSPHLLSRVVSRALPIAIGLLALVFLGRGALAYRDDVAFIEGEMVATAFWLNDNTSPGDLLAVHDIGAVGYYTDRPLLDLAGLITPEVIAFMTDADLLMEWMLEQGADYAVFFPDFSPTYAALAAHSKLEQLHCTGYAWTRSTGHENMCVYRVLDPDMP